MVWPGHGCSCSCWECPQFPVRGPAFGLHGAPSAPPASYVRKPCRRKDPSVNVDALTSPQKTEFARMTLAYRMVCLGSGLSPEVMTAIWCHETAVGTSDAWKEAYNPGGLKYRRGFFITECFGKSRTGLYARYPNHIIAAA